MDRSQERPGDRRKGRKGQEPADATDAPDNVIALSRYRAELGRGRRLRRADTLLGGPDPERAIRALPGDELYYVIHEIGLRDAGDILQYARPEQVQAALDFAVWDRDRIDPSRLGEWLEALADAPHERIAAWLAGLDVELVALFLRRGSRIYDLSQEEPPPDPIGAFYATPDGFFVLDVGGGSGQGGDGEADGDGDEGSAEAASPHAVARLLDALYRVDRDLARRILVGARAELDAELEELALRWRQGRMADLGFADYHEALEVYRELDPTSVRVGESAPGGARVRPLDAAGSAEPAVRLPGALIDRVGGGGTPFARAVRALTSAEETAELHFALVSLTNRVLAADRVAPGDDAAVAAVMERLVATLDLAVELLARGDDAVAREAVRTVPLTRLFRVGVSLTGKLRRLGHTLRKRGPFAATGRDLAEPEDALVLDAVTRARPLYPAALDDPPAAGERPFRSLGDLARATAAIERAAAAQALLGGLGVTPRDVEAAAVAVEAAVLDTGIIARTVLVRRLLAGARGPGLSPHADPPMSLEPLEPRDLKAFEALLEAQPDGPMKLPESLKKKAKAILDAAAPGRLAGAAAGVAERWIAGLAPLEPVLVRRPPPPSRSRKR
jgi:hypothetical protein